MKRLALTLLICSLAAGAQAAGSSESLFACGINFGNKNLTYSAPPESSQKKKESPENLRLGYIAGSVLADPVTFRPRQAASAPKREKRLPRNFTFATVGCSWR